jgi:hypothetical protein
MNTLLYNNRNGCFKMCNTCKDDDKLYRYEIKIKETGFLQGYIDYTKKNEVTKLIWTVITDTIKAKTDGKYWYQWDEDNNTWSIIDTVDTNPRYDSIHSYKTIIKCDE